MIRFLQNQSTLWIDEPLVSYLSLGEEGANKGATCEGDLGRGRPEGLPMGDPSFRLVLEASDFEDSLSLLGLPPTLSVRGESLGFGSSWFRGFVLSPFGLGAEPLGVWSVGVLRAVEGR